MAFNFLRDPSVPVRRGAGPPQYIPPWRICECGAGWELAAPRPDLGGALIQMLIGLLQAGCPPEGDRQWAKWLHQPPPAEELRQALQGLEPFFNLDDGDHRFMQDMDCPVDGEGFSLSTLLPDQPAGNALKLNKDFFVKAGNLDGMCPACLAAALYWRQTSMGGFGGGFRDSLRLKTPLTTVVLGDGLWQTLWLNVLPRPEFERWSKWSGKPKPADRFPWMGTVARSDKNQAIMPDKVHPDQVYWPMAHSVVVDAGEVEDEAACPVCGRAGQTVYRSYHRRKHGPLYFKSGWQHPLSATEPHSKDNVPVFVQTPKGGICYRDWLGLLTRGSDDDQNTQRPAVVDAFLNRAVSDSGPLPMDHDYRAWVFGLEMDQAKSLLFNHSIMPLTTVPRELRPAFENAIAGLVATAEEAAQRLAWAVKDALFKAGRKVNVSQGAPAQARSRLWVDTEAAFRQALGEMKRALEDEGPNGQAIESIKEQWLQTLGIAARVIFQDLAELNTQDKTDPKRKAQASNLLRRSVGDGTKKLRAILQLPDKPAARAGGEA